MLTLLIRTVILYIIVIALIRLMGKRTIAELQVSEFVITLLISDIAAVPMQEVSVPLLSGVLPIILIASLEVMVSYLMLKSRKISTFLNGSSMIVVDNGSPNTMVMKQLRMTCSDLMESLRKKDVFDINEVRLAVVETDGSISVLKKDGGGEGRLLISDGEPCTGELGVSQEDEKAALKELKRGGVKIEEVFMLVRDDKGKYTLIKK